MLELVSRVRATYIMDASVIEYSWEPEIGSDIKTSPKVEQFVFFFSYYQHILTVHHMMEEAILCTGPTCLTIKKRYPPYIAGLSSWIPTSFLALLLLPWK